MNNKNSKIAIIQTNESDSLIFSKFEICLGKLTNKNDSMEYLANSKQIKIDNKYYNCNLELKLIKQSLLDDFLSNSSNIEGLIVICDFLDVNNHEVSTSY